MKTQIRRHLLTLVVSLSLIASGQSARQSKERAVSIPSDAATRIGQLQKIDAQKSMIKGLYRQLTKARFLANRRGLEKLRLRLCDM